jgi:hypothetical protein
MLMYYCNLLITQLNTTVVVVSRWINNCPKFICFFAPSIVQHTLACMLAWLQPKLTIAYVERERKKTKISRACVPHQSSSLDQVMSKLHMIKYRSHARERYQGPASPACLISHDFARDRYDA